MPRPVPVHFDQAAAAAAVADAQAVRSAAERVNRDLLVVTNALTLDPGEQTASATVRFMCAEVADGDRRLG